MDTTDPDISFDAEGVCNHCRRYDERIASSVLAGEEGERRLTDIAASIAKEGVGRRYDCVIGVSGGVDSTFAALQTKRLGLRVLAVHLDNGWDSEVAVANITSLVRGLGIDLYTHVIDWEEFRDLQVAFLRASTPDSEIPSDHAIVATMYQVAEKYGVRSVFTGYNLRTESHLPRAWSQGHYDWRYIRSVHRLFGGRPLTSFPHMNLWTYRRYLLRFRTIDILNFVDYSKTQAIRLLQHELGWRPYGGKHHESLYTRFYQGYLLPLKFGYDKRKAHLSSLVCAGEITREEALAQLREPPYPPELQIEDRNYVIKKLGLTESEFERIMALPAGSYWDYPSYGRLYANPVFSGLRSAWAFLQGRKTAEHFPARSRQPGRLPRGPQDRAPSGKTPAGDAPTAAEGGAGRAEARDQGEEVALSARRAALVLFTLSLPYMPTEEYSFLLPELAHLRRSFERIVIVPKSVTGKRLPLPQGIEVDDSLPAVLSRRQPRLDMLGVALRSSVLRGDLGKIVSRFPSPSALWRLTGWTIQAERTCLWLREFLDRERERRPGVRHLFYTYWLNEVATGIAMALEQDPGALFVSRAHGFDLYEDRHSPAYIPGRRLTLRRLTRLFLISEHGRNHVVSRYPEVAARTEISRLGVSDPQARARGSEDQDFRVVSCSAVVPVKQVDLVLRGLAAAATRRPDRIVHWTHIGGGELLASIVRDANEIAPPNLRFSFRGHVDHEEVIRHYREHPADLFVNASRSEGVPVAIMEAQAAGIPAIAPRVGGMAEIVTGANGILLTSRPTAEEIGQAVLSLMDSPDLLAGKREASVRMWAERYDADRNFRAFGHQLRSLLLREGWGGP